MDTMEDLEETTPTELNIEDVVTIGNINKKTIEAIEEVNKEVLEVKLIKPIKLVSVAKDFILKTKQCVKTKVTTQICDSEIDLENMYIWRLDVILKDYKLWNGYRDKMQQSKTS
jgi:hypothetical protein